MPYKTNKDLPESIQHVLPKHAQDIFREAFNHAWKEYVDPEKRYHGDSLEDTARKVAWAAVKHKYEKIDDEWVEKE